MNHSRRIGFSIPIYKRPDQLLRCVSSVIIAARPYQVPIYLVDDSTDSTNCEAVKNIQELYPYVYYERNDRNIGIDRNILKSIDLCDCDYTWSLGEDDRLKPDAVQKVLAVLENNEKELPFIFVNYAGIDKDAKMVLTERSLNFYTDQIKNVEEFILADSWSMGFIGACVIKKSLWKEVRQEPYLDTYFAHVGIILEYLKNKSVYMIAEPLVFNRSGGSDVYSWSENTFDVLHGWSRMMDELRPIYGDSVCDQGIESYLKVRQIDTIRFLISKRADNVYNLGVYNDFIKKTNSGNLYRLLAYLIARTDSRLFRAAKDIYFRVKYSHSRIIEGY